MSYNVVGLPITYARSGAQWQDRSQKVPRVLWRPKDSENTPMSRYRRHINKKFKAELRTSHDLHRWSCANPHKFWIDLYEYTDIIPPLPSGIRHAYDPAAKFRDIPIWFEGHKLNFAENLLIPNLQRAPDGIALTGLREGKLGDPEHITWSELHDLVRITQAALLHHGVKQNDVVAALMSNSIWIIVIFLATASIGAIYTSISPDMGLSGCLSRLAQVTPKLLFTDTDYATRGTRVSLLDKVRDIIRGLPTEQKRPDVIFVPTVQAAHKVHHNDFSPTIPTDLGYCLSTFLETSHPSDSPLEFKRLSNDHPLVILYSSGTTGPPKCIVSPHISILNYRKIAHLHNSLGPSSIIFQYSSTSWILWNVMGGHMSVGARLITFDGNPLYPDAGTPLEICERYGATYWGTSPRYLLELEQQTTSGSLRKNFDLNKLTMVTTTGAPLLPSQMEFFYSPLFPSKKPTEEIHLSSVAGGTDIASSWIASNPAGPVYTNEMQMWALGHDCDIISQDPTTSTRTRLDAATKTQKEIQNLEWKSVRTSGEPGELVCKKPIPSAPVYFWGDDEKKTKYMDAYFNSFPSVVNTKTGEAEEYVDIWCQSDLTTSNASTAGLQILGRSDTTLNPSGIRFGSSEIYNIVEAPPFNALINDSLCVGRRRKGDSDEVVFLFVIPAKDVHLDEELLDKIRASIRTNLSSRHVPKFIFKLEEGQIPYTLNGKRVENVVKKLISGTSVTPSSTIVNPGCLEEYKKYKDVERQPSARRSKL